MAPYTGLVSAKSFDPLHLDVAPFAKAGGALAGTWPLPGLARLAAECHEQAPATDADVVSWSLRGERRDMAGAAAQTWVHLDAQATLSLVCQRCLAPVALGVQARRSFLFVPSEAEAAALDEQTEDDVLALSSALDGRALVEDELLLALPLVPRHEDCSMPLAGQEPAAAEPARPNPFAALRGLRRDGGD